MGAGPIAEDVYVEAEDHAKVRKASKRFAGDRSDEG